MNRPAKHKPRVRIRLRLTRGGWICLAAIPILIALAYYLHHEGLFWAIGIIVGALTVSWFVPRLMLRGLEARRTAPAQGAVGEPLTLAYHIANRRRRIPAFGLVISEVWPKQRKAGWLGRFKRTPCDQPVQLAGPPVGWGLHLGAGQSAAVEAVCWPRRRGQLQFQRIAISTCFPFGLVHATIELPQPDDVLIFPELYRLNRRFAQNTAGGSSQERKRKQFAGTCEEFYGLREYRTGDSLKIVDWKRTSRTGRLVSREMAAPTPGKLMLLLDLRANGNGNGNGKVNGKSKRARTEAAHGDAVERAVSLAASILCDWYHHGHEAGLAVHGASCPTFTARHSQPHQARMLEALARMKTDDAPPSRDLPANATLVIRLQQPHHSELDAGYRGRLHLSADQLKDYIIPQADMTGSILRSAGALQQGDASREEVKAWT